MEKKAPEPAEKILGLERNVFFAGLTSFLTDTSTKMVYSVMPLFLLSIGASKTTLALIEGIAESTASLLKAFSGFWSDKLGKNKPFMLLGYGITALITPIYSQVVRPWQVLVLRFIERAGKGFRTAPRDSLIAGSVQNNEAGKSFGFHKAMDNSGAIVGPLIAFFLLTRLPESYTTIFLIATIPAILGVLTIALFIKEVKGEKKEGGFQFRFAQLPRRFYWFLAIIFVFTLGNSTDALLLVKASETGIKVAYVPFAYLVFNGVSVLFAVPFGRLSDRVGRERLLIAGYLIYSVVYFGFGRFSAVGPIFLLFAAYGLYSALTDGNQKALVSDFLGKETKGTGFGLYHALLGITLLPASLIAGTLYDKVGSTAAFYFGSVMALLASLLMTAFYFSDKKINR
ncbi:MAG: MFS transporter [Lewinellaceae bacterium]|nr:MFS transporter [Lewinellaceae bacterium]